MSDQDNDFKIVQSLSGADKRLIRYIPYLLKDLFELGSKPIVSIELLDRALGGLQVDNTVLDLCCGKGANVLQFARKYGIRGIGIDLFPPFIDDAREIAVQLEMQNFVEFNVMDLRTAVTAFRDIDLVIFGADTDVLGNEIESLQQITACCRPGKHILYETATLSINILEYIFTQSGLNIVDSQLHDREQLHEINIYNTEKIKQRAGELKELYPEKSDLFDTYVQAQEDEVKLLETEMISVTYLLQTPR
ncbi:MAG: class I SAM-dependent methyltransferase [Ignavibacteria bacterium]|nr:class I SAM-dependent methyltransferase [Ignavibacteria bacterium]